MEYPGRPLGPLLLDPSFRAGRARAEGALRRGVPAVRTAPASREGDFSEDLESESAGLGQAPGPHKD